MSVSDEEAYQRWRQRSLEQIGVYNNVLIGLASGAVVFATPMLAQSPDSLPEPVLGVILVALFLCVGSLALGIWAMSNRIEGFRIAARRARARARNETPGPEFSTERRDAVDKTTLQSLRWQGVTFLFALAVFCAALVVRRFV